MISLTGASSVIHAAEANLKLGIVRHGPQLELRWQSSLALPLSTSVAAYELQGSQDFLNWQAVGPPVTSRMGVADEILRTTIDPQATFGFYRLVGQLKTSGAKASGAEVFGYGNAFAQELGKLGQISPATFSTLYPAPTDYLEQISFDPTTALYWPEFNKSPAFKLNDQELDVFKRQGFVVSERLGGYSFADVYYRIYSGDLPVFVSTDAILQAWHFSYQAMLLELEMTYLYSTMEEILNGMNARLPLVWQQQGQGVLKESILDADLLITVARSLLAGKTVTTPSPLGQDTRVAATLAAIQAEKTQDCFELFGEPRAVDFSQFKVRGHYESNERLGRYFQCLMWLGRTDLRVAGGPYQDSPCAEPHHASLRELGTAIVLYHLLAGANEYSNWQSFDQVIQTFVGQTDSLTFAQLGALLRAVRLVSLADVTSIQVLQRFQENLENGAVGLAQIGSDYFYSPLGGAQVKLPVSFTVSGQKFVVDSWALSKVVFDEVIWDDNGVPELEDKLPRRKPSGLDVAFAVLANNQVVPELVSRIEATDGVPFRDGYFYQHNLAAVRNVIDRQAPASWSGSMYAHWLASLRTLSAPTQQPPYPECLRTRAWALKTLNTQLASWTDLRHDTVLYAKQSYTEPVLCIYPEGYVEPRTGFWQRMAVMAWSSADLIGRLNFQGQIKISPNDWNTIDLARVHQNELQFLSSFADTMDSLAAISQKELAQQSLTQTENSFLAGLMEDPFMAYVKQKQYSGWYPRLFYKNLLEGLNYGENEGSDKWDALVTDVHTDTPDGIHGDPGAVIHEAVGNVHLLMLAVDCGADRMVYAGPVHSYFEFETPKDVRKTDSEWKTQIKQGQRPPHPEWTRRYLVPGAYSVPAGIDH